MVTNVSIKGFDEFVKFTDSIDPKGPPVYFYFDSKLPDGTTSWCPDCVVGYFIITSLYRSHCWAQASSHGWDGMGSSPHAGPLHIHFLNFFSGVCRFPHDVFLHRKANAEPIVRGFLREVKKDLIFVHVDCGPRDNYKDPQCVFRTDARSKIRRIPTLLKWQGDRLEEAELNEPEKLWKLFEV